MDIKGTGFTGLTRSLNALERTAQNIARNDMSQGKVAAKVATGVEGAENLNADEGSIAPVQESHESRLNEDIVKLREARNHAQASVKAIQAEEGVIGDLIQSIDVKV